MVAAQVSSTQDRVDENLYEKDFYAWTQEQAALMSQGKWTGLDVPNLVEEIESLGRQQRSELRNRLIVLLMHLLKWEYQPDKRSRSWSTTIRLQRIDIADLLAESPSLKPYLAEAIDKAYKRAVIAAANETSLPETTFPSKVGYPAQQVLDSSFFPGEEI